MKATLRIARAEIASIFYSPIAWLLLIIFSAQSFLTFDDLVKDVLYMNGLGMQNSQSLSSLLLSGVRGSLLNKMNSQLFLYIPLLTMGVIARETYSGSIKLLLSSPIKISQIIVGKYLALMAFCSLLILVLLAIAFVGMQGIENVEYLPVLSGVLGLFLLMSTYVAIGLFMSCLTVHQVVAAISTLTVLAILNYIGGIGQGVLIVRDITYWLSLSGRTNNFLLGMITSKDVLYFMLVTSVFLSFAIMKLSSGRKIETKAKKAGKYILVITMAMCVGTIMSRPAFVSYLDVTRLKRNSLSDTSLAIIEPMKGKQWKLIAYVNLLDLDFYKLGLPIAKKDDFARFEKYTQHIPNLVMESVFYYDGIYKDSDVNAFGNIIQQRYPDKSNEEIARIIRSLL